MCLRVSPCSCVFEFSYVFINVEACVWVESKVFLCDSNQMLTNGKAYASRFKGIHM